ncbi:MAG TPA: 3-deoxy-manno-octulosonate cytidylyltransferase [Candidatus Coprousia avicola]|nr:3-deoxy-manno-octulosonate cytidylyltransferase [Candidatus Coprousia avicola]
MKTIGLIPARWESSRFPGKPLALISGKPMIWWVHRQCMCVPQFDDVVVATDDRRIVQACESFGAKAVMTSASHPTGTDRIAEAAAELQADLFVNVQGDEPLVAPEALGALVDYCTAHPDVQAVNLIAPLADAEQAQRESVVKVVCGIGGDILYLSRSLIPGMKGGAAGRAALEGATVPYYRQLGVYAIRPQVLSAFARYGKEEGKSPLERIEDVEMLRLIEHGVPVRALITDEVSPAVDYPGDIAAIEARIVSEREV